LLAYQIADFGGIGRQPAIDAQAMRSRMSSTVATPRSAVMSVYFEFFEELGVDLFLAR